MKLYIYHEDEGLFVSNYHSGGGIVVIADNEEDANIVDPRTARFKPIAVFELAESVTKKEAFGFPDSGCC